MKNNKTVKISVIMSVLNGEQYMSKGIDSIINQTYQDWEFIICDDGSTDNTWNILQNYAKKDKRIKSIKNEKNYGLAYSLNKCIELAQSDILARQDADDESDIHRFEKQYKYMKKHPEYSIVGTSWKNIAENNKTWNTYPIEFPQIKDLLWDGGFMHPSWMMRKKDLAKIDFYTANKYTRRDQDYHLILKLYGEGMKMCNMQEILYYYTNDSNTFLRTKKWKYVKGLMWIRYDGYKRNNLPLWNYIYVLKPLLKNILPKAITKKYYLRNQNK